MRIEPTKPTPRGGRTNAGRRDYSPRIAGRARRQTWPRAGFYPVLGAIAGALMIFVLVGITDRAVDADTRLPRSEWLPVASLEDAAQDAAGMRLETVLAPGDTAIAALKRLGFDGAAIQAMIEASRPVYSLARVQAGHRFVRLDRNGRTLVRYRLEGERWLELARADDGWQARIVETEIRRRQRLAAGVVHDSLFAAAAKAGLDERTTMNLVDIFAWDIDFARDIREGDRFRVLYEERFDAEGRELGTRILAAEFVNQGRRYRAVRYRNAKGEEHFYTPDGQSMRKAYLRAPVKYTRISSRFSLSRKHPVLGYTRAHKGVDYAAPAGTPVHAIGDGYVRFAGWKGGYGRLIVIRHTNREHSTAYAHLRRFARGIRKGVRVHQGQVIGYVGMSGLATGPHLHFEFRIRNRPVNPLSIRSRPARPVPASEMARFREQTAPWLAMLSRIEPSDWS